MHSSFARSRTNLFDGEDSVASSMTQSQIQTQTSTSNSLFQDDSSPWELPTPRKKHSRADLLRGLLPTSDVPQSYIETFDAVVRDDDGSAAGKVSAGGVTRVLASAKLPADAQAKIMGIVAPGGGEVALGRNEFNVLLGLVGLAQEGETVSLDGVDERRRSEFAFSFVCFESTVYFFSGCIIFRTCISHSTPACLPRYYRRCAVIPPASPPKQCVRV